ncbi:hypothetical protein ACJRPK_16020 [Aquimarina sp. 2-A2]|uniref:hypothetical protein n=1 Tax=Aquimarina sp. 2-A2 TaxID=3382644 RepID=UPI00387EF76C
MKPTLLLLFLSLSLLSFGQDMSQIGKAPLLKVNGGVSANGIYYDGSANREPFTYFLNGNLNFNISGIYNIPLSFSYTNQEFGYSTPFKINRLSIHPSYKWVATHIGDVSMSFSPYTVSGHQFTGFGVDLTPNKPYKISAFYGRLLKATEYNDEFPEALPAYRRMGYGTKASYEFDRVTVGVIAFGAKDDEESIELPVPSDLNLTPKQNVVLSLESSIQATKNLNFHVEIAQSAITEDTEDQGSSNKGNAMNILINDNSSTSYYTALNANFTYAIGKGTVGAGYERIDPEYRTFGAYYFNNDLENITLNASQTLFGGAVSLAANVGLQRDDLKDKKDTQSNRVVSSFNSTINASDRFNIAASYSNFQSYTNIRSVFDEINEVDPLENLDTLDFRQISQNATLQLGYILSQDPKKQQNVGLSLTYQTTKDEQGTAASTNTQSNFYNVGANYSIGYPERALTISSALNAAYNELEENRGLTIGPTLNANKQFFNKQLRTGLSASYNETLNNGTSQGSVTSIRANAGYTYKEKHNLMLSALSQLRKTEATGSQNDFTLTFGYSYSFDIKKAEIRFQKRAKAQGNQVLDSISKQNFTRFRYRDEIYEGNPVAIVEQLETLTKKEYLDDEKAFSKELVKSQLANLKIKAIKSVDFKNLALDYLDSLYVRKDFIPTYRESLLFVTLTLKKELFEKEEIMKERFSYAKSQVEQHKLHTVPKDEQIVATTDEQALYNELQTKYTEEADRMEAYLYLRVAIEELRKAVLSQAKSHQPLLQLQAQTAESVFDIAQKTKNLEKINIYLEEQIIAFFDDRYQNGID